jgi:hypothetical protein
MNRPDTNAEAFARDRRVGCLRGGVVRSTKKIDSGLRHACSIVFAAPQWVENEATRGRAAN